MLSCRLYNFNSLNEDLQSIIDDLETFDNIFIWTVSTDLSSENNVSLYELSTDLNFCEKIK